MRCLARPPLILRRAEGGRRSGRRAPARRGSSRRRRRRGAVRARGRGPTSGPPARGEMRTPGWKMRSRSASATPVPVVGDRDHGCRAVARHGDLDRRARVAAAVLDQRREDALDDVGIGAESQRDARRVTRGSMPRSPLAGRVDSTRMLDRLAGIGAPAHRGSLEARDRDERLDRCVPSALRCGRSPPAPPAARRPCARA